MTDESPMQKALRLRSERLKIPAPSTAAIDPPPAPQPTIEEIERNAVERNEMVNAGFDPDHPVHVDQFRREKRERAERGGN